MSYIIRRVLAKPRLILDEMCRLYGKFVSYLRRVLCKTCLIFPRINGPNKSKHWRQVSGSQNGTLSLALLEINPNRNSSDTFRMV